MRVLIDGKEYSGSNIKILEEDSEPVEKVTVKQFARGSQGLVEEVETLFMEVFTETVEAPALPMCADRPIVPQTFEWVWYRGMRWPIHRDEFHPNAYFSLPGEDALEKFCEKNKDKLEQVRKNWLG
jgi:hypothetical protein